MSNKNDVAVYELTVDGGGKLPVAERHDRARRLRVGELIIGITNGVFAKHGSRAYTLYALLAGKCTKVRHLLIGIHLH